MRYRLFGRTGLRDSELFLGAMRFGSVDQARPIIDLYAGSGGNVIDTADAYGGSEEIVGEVLAGRRDRFVVASKYSLPRDPSDINAAGNHRKNLRLALESSLRRLRTDHLDIYWVHFWDRHTPVEETLRALDDAVRTGKILYAGISEAPSWIVARANTLAQWHDWTEFAGLQVPYSLLQRDIERELLPMAEAFGLTVAAWAPLAHGKLGRSADTALDERERKVLAAVQEVARELGATPAQVALAWTRAHSRAVHPLAGASSPAQLADNLAALELELPGEAVGRLEAATEFELGFPRDLRTDDFLGPHQLDGR
ncbi:aldo/keto reductase [Kribbella sp. VKM Ac-2568]|uniref:aldo/keto reductase n=1 Tax=Kribbella sp. VKM Ac-2568 TaxID=2512219 RepID=UPI0010432FE7|nr:aldo/keto reductase [Kribbella sp. VKM Ac-2568]TCM45712.1 aryl-alcohol dehydrogenase-like predicted oxidoreductase [Kribbella sp. VKM Ac-2568]